MTSSFSFLMAIFLATHPVDLEAATRQLEAEAKAARGTEMQVLFDSALADYKAGDCAKAMPALKTLAAAGYRSSETAQGLRTCYSALYGAGAVARLEEEVRVNPGDAVAHGNLGVFYLAEGKKEESQKELLAALTLTPRDIDARLNMAFWYTFVGQSRAAVTEHENILVDDPKNRRALTELCYLLSERENDVARALPYCERAATGSAEAEADENAAVTLGIVRMRAGDLDGAEAAYQAVLAKNEAAHVARTFYGVSRLQRGDVPGAQAAFKAVLAKDATKVDARVGLARTFQARKEYGQAAREYRTAYGQAGGALILGALVKAYLQQYFYLIVGALLAAMGLLLWRYLNVKMPEDPAKRSPVAAQ